MVDQWQVPNEKEQMHLKLIVMVLVINISHSVNMVSLKSLMPLPSLASTTHLEVVPLNKPYWNPCALVFKLSHYNVSKIKAFNTHIIMQAFTEEFYELIVYNQKSKILLTYYKLLATSELQ